MSNTCKEEIYAILEKLLNQGKNIILYDVEDFLFLYKFIEHCKKLNIDIEVWVNGGKFSKLSFVRSLSNEDFSIIKNLYYLYEFNDKFTMITNDKKYASIFNFVEQGILDENEVIEAILYKIG